LKETIKVAVITGSEQVNGDNLKNTRHEASRHFRNKKRDDLKDKINELANEQYKQEHQRPM
jgi:hypothetical protein